MDLNISSITLTVTNLNDSGEGSLRQVLADAQKQATDTITVNVVFEPSLAGTITLSNNLTIPANVAVILSDGVVINHQGGYDITVYGTLKSEYAVEGDAFVSSSSSYYNNACVYVQNGGVVELKNANINFSGYGQVYVYSGGTFRMTGGSLKADSNGAYIQSGGTMQLTGVEVKNKIENQGSLILEDVSVNSYVNGSGRLEAKDSVISDYVDAYGTTILENVSCLRLNVNSDTSVTTKGEGVTLTGEQALQLKDYSGTVATLLDSFTWTATAENAYIGITGYLYTATLSNISDDLRGEYKLEGNVTVASGHTVILSDGVVINHQGGYDITVYGTLKAEYAVEGDAFVSSSSAYYNNACVYVQNGGVVELKNANINFSGYGQVYVYSGGTFRMTGGSLNADSNGAYIQSGGTMQLTGVEVKNKIENQGSLILEDVSVNSGVIGSGRLEAKDCVISDYVDAYGTTILENVSCLRLNVNSDTSVTTKGEGVTLTGEQALQLKDYSGTVATLLDSFTWTATAENAYIGITGYLYTATLSNISDDLRGEYKLEGNVTVASGHTVILSDGVVINHQGGYDITVYGTLKAEYAVEGDAFVSSSSAYYNNACVYVQNGGVVELKNANINFSGYGQVYVYSGGTFRMTGGSLKADSNGAYIQSGGTMQLTGVEVKNKIENQGSLILEDVSVNSGVIGSGRLEAKDCVISDYVDAYGTTILENVSCLRLNVNSDTSVTTKGEGVTLTGEQALLLKDYSGTVATLLDSFTWTATVENAYIGITGYLYTATLSNISDDLRGEYKLEGNVTVASGHTVTMEEGCTIGHQIGYSITVCGILKAEYETEEDAFVASSSSYYNYGRLYVQNGGVVELKNANINFSGYGQVYVYSGGTFRMTGGSLKADSNGAYIQSGGVMQLTGVEVKNKIENQGSLIMENVSVNSYVSGSGRLEAKDSVISDYVDAYGTTILENVSCLRLNVNSDTSVTTKGEGVTLTGEQALQLKDYSGTVATLLDSFTWTATAEEAYIGIQGNLYTSTLSDISELMDGEYRMVGELSVASGHTVSLDEGVFINQQNWRINVYGVLKVENEEVADAFVSSSTSYYSYGSVYVQKGGVMELKNANINFSGYGQVYVYSGGTFRMTGGSLKADSKGTYIQSGGTMHLTGVEVKNPIDNQGALVLESCTFSKQSVTIAKNATATITNTSGISTLTINSGSTVSLVGNDFSATTIKLNNFVEGEIIDLSGNYWGTTDMDAIIAKIQGYDEGRVLIGTILAEPNAQVFSFDASMLGAHRVSDKARSVTLVFNALVDATSVRAGSIQLIDSSGESVQISGYEVEGNKVIIMLDSLPQGTYTVNVSSDVKDVRGNAFSVPEGQRQVNFLSLELSSPKVIFFRANSTVTDQFRYVDIFFDQEMDDSCITKDNVHIYAEDGTEVTITRILKSGVQGNIFFRAYFDKVVEKGTYRVVVDSEVTTTDGRTMDSDYVKEVYVVSPDLTVTDAIDVSDNRIGRYTTITYTVQNVGDGEAMGGWTDNIYLCKSEQWNESEAIFFASVTGNDYHVGSGETYTKSAKGILDGVTPGTYYVFVKTDMSSRLNESDELNNISATGTQVVIGGVLRLQDGVALKERLNSANETLYAQMEAVQDASMVFTVDSKDAKVVVRDGSNNAPVKTIRIWDGSVCRYYFAAVAGETYLVSVNGGKSATYEISGDVAGFSLTNVSSLTLAAGKQATITVNGACFESGMQFYLIDSDGNKYEPSVLNVLDSCTARMEISVPDSLPADTELTLMAVNSSGETISLAERLYVADYADALEVKFNTRMNGEKNIQRVGWIWKTDFTVTNVSGSDLSGAIVLVTDTANDFAMYYSYEDGKARDRSALMFNCGTQDGEAHIMEAGESGKYGVFVKHYRSGSGSIQAWVMDPTSTEIITEERWQQIESALRPASCSDEEWSAWWGNIQPRIGETEGDFVSFIHEMQSFNTASPQASVADLVEQTMETMPDYVPGYGITGHVYDSQTGEVLSGELLHIYTWDESGNLVHLGSTETDSAGYFYYYGLDDSRSYRIVTDSTADNDRNGISDKGYTDITLNSGSDLEQDFYVMPGMMIGEVSQNSCYQYEDSSTGVKFCSWNRNGTHMVAYGEGADRKEFCISDQYCYGSSLVWSDSLGGMVLVWVEDDRLAYRLLKEDASGLLVSDVVYENVKDGSELSLLDVYTNNDGKLTAILDSASDGGTLILQLTEELLADVALSQLSVSGALFMTEGEGSKELWSYDSGRNRLLETFGLKFSRVEGNLEVSYTAEENSASAGLSGSFGISYSPLKDHASYKASVKLSFGGNVTANLITGESDDATSGPICIEQRPGANGGNPCYVDFSGSTSLGITVSMESRTGLISLLYKIPDPSGITKAIGAGLDALNSLLKAVGYHLYAGYNLSASATYNYDTDAKNKHSCRMEASGGVTLGWQPKPGSKQTAWSSKVMTDLGVNAGFTVNISDFSITNPTFELYGNLSIKTPTYPGVGHLEYDGAIMDLLTGKTSVTFVPDEELENSKTWKMINLARSSKDKSIWEIAKDTYLILTDDEEEEKPKPKKITRKKRTVDLFSEGAQITDMKGATLSDNQLCLIAAGRVSPSSIVGGEYDMESLNTLLIEQQKQVVLQTFALDGESGVLSDLNQSALVFESLDLYTAGVQENSQSSASFDITSHIISTDVVSSGGNIYMAWVTFHEGMYYTFSSQLEGDTWQSPLLVAVGQNEVSSCYFVESGNRLILAMDSMLTTSTYDTEVYSQQYSLENNSWVDITVYPDESLPEETGASAKKVFRGFLETFDSIKDTLGTLLKCDSIKLAPKKKADASLEHSQFCSYDPNDFYGPNGYGKDNWIAPQEMEFQILCENIPEENIAHTAMVTIKHTVDKAYDYSTFRLGTMVIAGNTIEVEGDVQSYKARLDWTSTLGVWVDVNAQFDAETGEAVWEFIAIDPATGYVVSDPFTGLLAPNYNPPEGDGWVYYYIEPDKTVSTGTSATSKADIYFDFNSPIITPTLTYTFDADAPVAAVQAMAEQSNTRYMRVAWEGSDKGSGIACYNVYVSVDGGNWQLWQEQIAATSALYTVAEGSHTYAFFAQGIDYAGNAELLSEVVESEVVVSSKYEPQQSSLSVASLSADYQGNILTLELTFSEAARCSNWLDALEVVGVSGKLDLSEGAVHYDSSCHTITWMGAVNTLSMGEKLIVRLKNGVVSDASGHYFTSEIPSYSVPVALGAVGQSYAAPTLVDYNGDGLLDLLVGESAGGVGKVRLYLNVGTEQAPEFNDFTYLTSAQDTDLTVIASGCQGAIVRMVDLTGDGEAELLVGLTDGTVRMFAASAEGHWQDSGLLNCSVGGNNDIIYVGSRAAIEFTDFNGDGRTDMLVGTGDGNLVLYLDTATSGATVFDAGQYLHDSAGRIRVGSRASVAVADVDGDGLADLLIGSSTGSILYYRNEGRAGEPLFGEGVQINSGDGVLDLSAETSRLRLSTGDLNSDGVVDIVLGRSDGSVSVLYGTQGATVLGTVQAGAAPEYMIDNVKVTTHGSTLLVSWDALEAEDSSYELSYRLKGDTAATVLKVMGTSTILTLPDGVYEVSVRGLSGDVNGPWSVAQEVLIDTVAPLSPQSLAATVGEAGLVTLAWTAADGASGYMLRYKETHSATWKTIRLSGKGTETTLYDVPAGIYQWQVCAVDAAGNRSAWSEGDKFSANGAAITESTHWAAGMLFDASGQVIGGYQDMNKVGAEDSNLCWAAAASNVLAWWQQQYPTGSVLNGVPQDAAAIYACFCDNWKNVSGAESYAYTWWLANDSNSFSYNSYYNTNYQGADDIGGWYSEYYGRQNIANHTAQVQLSTLEAADVSSAWEGVYNGGGMLALGVFNGYSNGALNGGHSLTLWGFTDDAAGYVCEIYVTDSDDNQEQLLTLSVAVDEVSGLYRVAEGQGSLSGYYLGTYTYLKAGGMAVDGDAVEKATQLGMASAGDGSGRYTANSLNWVGAGDAVDYYSITAAGDGAYRVAVDTAALETAVQVSVGVLNAQGEFEAQQELLLAPGAALGTLPGVAVEQGQTLYVKVEAVGGEQNAGGFYELSINGTVPSAGSGLATQNNRAEEATESAADGSSTRGWVGAGDACDFYRVEMANAGSLSLALGELESGARVRIYEQREDGTLAQLQSIAVRSGSELDRTLNLTTGSYFVEVASLDNGAGMHNTAYSLTLKKEEEEQQNSSGLNLA